MASNTVPSALKSDLEKACKKAVEKVKKLVPGAQNEKKVAERLSTSRSARTSIRSCSNYSPSKSPSRPRARAQRAAPGTPPKVDAIPKLKAPGGSAPSLTLPLGSFDLLGDKKKDSKLELKIWGDPPRPRNTPRRARRSFSRPLSSVMDRPASASRHDRTTESAPPKGTTGDAGDVAGMASLAAILRCHGRFVQLRAMGVVGANRPEIGTCQSGSSGTSQPHIFTNSIYRQHPLLLVSHRKSNTYKCPCHQSSHA